MRVVRDLSQLPGPLHKSAVAIGNFDGIHMAHRELLRRVVHSARELGGTSVVITFDPHPALVLAPERAPKILTPLDLKTRLIEKEGIELLAILPFNQELFRLSPKEFVRSILVEKLRTAAVHVGSNFRFGYQRAGDTTLLAKLGQKEGFHVETLPMLRIRGHRVSSSQVRHFLSEGKVEIAGRLLGRPYSVRGDIATGEGIGHKQTVPTLNLGPVEQQLPNRGVYITRTGLGGRLHESVTNVGHKPTFGHYSLTIESFLLNIRNEIKAKEMEIQFLHRLRDEIKFPSVEALRQQIQQDVQRSRKFFRLINRLSKTKSTPNHSLPIRN